MIGGMIMELKIKDPGSALTHFIAMLTAMVAATPLLIKAASVPGTMHLKALSVFIVSMILLYAASTENRPHDDLHPDRRNLHTGVPDRPRK